MKRLLLSMSLLLLPGVLLAQPGSGSGSTDATQGSGPNHQATFRGCLEKASSNYTLTNEETGASYLLTGDTDALDPHVGLTVEVQGEVTTSGINQPGAMAGVQSDVQPTLHVQALVDVSGACQRRLRPDLQPPQSQ